MKNLRQKISLFFGPGGAILVSLGYNLEPNIIWFFSNVLMTTYFHQIKEKELTIQMSIYTCIALFGIINLGIINR